jgi:hypothetical protein
VTESHPNGLQAAKAVEFLLRFARTGHAAGYPTAELENRLLVLATHLGLSSAQVSATRPPSARR